MIRTVLTQQPIFIQSIKEHQEIKKNLLSFFEDYDTSITDVDNISKTDWETSSVTDKPYVKYFFDSIGKYINNLKW